MTDALLHELDPGRIWIAERTLWFSGVRLRSRMTVVRVADGRLWLHSTSAPTDELCAALDRLGAVSWIVVPNRFHHMNAAAMKARYRDACVIGPATARDRNKNLALDVTFDDASAASLVPDLSPVPLQGAPFLDETLVFDAPSRTLIAADLMMCGCPADHWTWRWTSRVTGQYLRYKAPPDVRWKTRRSPLVAASLDEIARLPVERILVAHSDPVVDRPLEQLAEAWRFARPT